MTFEVETTVRSDGSNSGINSTIAEVTSLGSPKKNVESKEVAASKRRPNENRAEEEDRSPVQDEMRTPSQQTRTETGMAAESPSTYHTPENINTPKASSAAAILAQKNSDLAKVRSALSQLNSAVLEEEEHYFRQLEATESMNTKLQQNLMSADELRQKNDELQEGLEEMRQKNQSMQEGLSSAQTSLSMVRAEATAQVESLKESLMSKDVEMANIQSEYRSMMDTKDSELQALRESIEKLENELQRLEDAYKGSYETCANQKEQLAALRADHEALQASFESVKAEKDEIEQGHEEAKEKWKRLVITMKSEYDNFRASFEHLKVAKREMEDTHRAEKSSLENKVAVLQSENGGLSAAMDSLKICKEVTESEYKEAKAAWDASKEALETQTQRLRSDLEALQEAKKDLDQKLVEYETTFEQKMRDQVDPLKTDLATTKLELASLESEFNSLQEVKEAIEQERGVFQNDNEELTKERDCLKEDLEKDRSELSTLTKDLEALNTKHESKVSECDALKAEIERMEVAKEEIEKMFSAIQVDFQIQKDDYERLKPMEEELENCTAQLEETKIRLSNLEQDKAELEKDLAETKEELEKQTNKANSLQVTFDGAKALHSEEKEMLEKKIHKLSRTVETKAEALKMALTKYMTELKAKEQLEKELNQKMADLKQAKDEEIARLNEQIESVIQAKDEERKVAIAKMNEKMEKNTKYESEQREAALQAQVAAENKLAEYEKVVAKTEAEMLSERCQGDSLREALEAIETEKRDALAKVDELSQLTSKWEEIKNENDKLRAECTIAEQRKKTNKQETEEMQAKISALNQSVAKKIATISALEGKLETLAATKREIEMKDKELELVRSRCESLQAALNGSEEELEKKDESLKELSDVKFKFTEANILVEKKTAELHSLQARCDMLQASLKKAESLYMNGVEHIKEEAVKKQRVALEEAQDRIYVLNQMLEKRDEEVSLMNAKLKDATGQDDYEMSAEAERRVVANSSLTKKLKSLETLVSSKDSELQLLKAQCTDLQALLKHAENKSPEQLSAEQKQKLEAMQSEETLAQEKLLALTKEIGAKQSKLKSLQNNDGDEFEVVLDSDDLKVRCTELEASMEELKKKYEEECERRKEAEQVFASISTKPSKESTRPPRGMFGRAKNADASSPASKWLSLRGRRKNDEMIVQTNSDIREEWRSQYSGSPRKTADTRGTRSVVGGGDGILSQIPHHIQNSFFEVGVYKQRLTNTYLPVLCLGPNDLPAGPVRDDWLNKIGNSKVQNLGVYYFGKDGKDEDAYGTIPWFAFISYTKADQRGLIMLPKAISEKIEKGKELTAEEKQIHDGMEALREAAEKKKEERTHPLQHLTAVSDKIPTTIVAESSASGEEEDDVSEMGV